MSLVTSGLLATQPKSAKRHKRKGWVGALSPKGAQYLPTLGSCVRLSRKVIIELNSQLLFQDIK